MNALEKMEQARNGINALASAKILADHYVANGEEVPNNISNIIGLAGLDMCFLLEIDPFTLGEIVDKQVEVFRSILAHTTEC